MQGLVFLTLPDDSYQDLRVSCVGNTKMGQQWFDLFDMAIIHTTMGKYDKSKKKQQHEILWQNL